MAQRYGELKAALLAAGASGRMGLNDMEMALRRYSALRRATQQLDKARQRLKEFGIEGKVDSAPLVRGR